MITGDRTILIGILHTLAAEARAERAKLPFDAAERQFYLGVEAATDAVVHPETYDAKPEGWLDREASSFRNGFLTTSGSIAAAVSSASLPARLSLPTPG